MRQSDLEIRGRILARQRARAARPGTETGLDGSSWRDVGERGSVLGIKAAIVLTTMLGRPGGRALVTLIAAYYTLFSPTAHRATRDFRAHLGLETRWRDVYRQVRRFAQCTLDALFFMRGETRFFRVKRNGHHHLARLRDTGQGAILLGAHLGSFHAMREQSGREALPLYPVVFTKNAQRFNEVLEELDPGSRMRLIEIEEGEGRMGFMLSIREKLEEGGLVAILGDRVQPGAKAVKVDFLGEEAWLPAGPYVLAATLKAPVYFVAGLYRGKKEYELFCIPFADRVVLPRRERQEAIQRYAQQYADLLARFCRDAPDNWFNFYDFWADRPADPSTRTHVEREERRD
jgi:predicted LPLAT superfamily acyltransferase